MSAAHQTNVWSTKAAEYVQYVAPSSELSVRDLITS